MKYKVGQRVRIINATYGWHIVKNGDIGTIHSYSSVGDYYITTNSVRYEWHAAEEDLETDENNVMKLLNKIDETSGRD